MNFKFQNINYVYQLNTFRIKTLITFRAIINIATVTELTIANDRNKEVSYAHTAFHERHRLMSHHRVSASMILDACHASFARTRRIN